MRVGSTPPVYNVSPWLARWWHYSDQNIIFYINDHNFWTFCHRLKCLISLELLAKEKQNVFLGFHFCHWFIRLEPNQCRTILWSPIINNYHQKNFYFWFNFMMACPNFGSGRGHIYLNGYNSNGMRNFHQNWEGHLCMGLIWGHVQRIIEYDQLVAL